ncbi:MAG: Amuc_1100 family pilus-like protein [Akkermansiaceae bacterium]
MNWFKENKFLGGLLVVTALIAGLLIFLGLKTADSRDAVAEERNAQKENLNKMKSKPLFPTIDSVAEKKANLQAVIAKAETMQAQFNTFRPESLENITVSTFSDRLKKSDASIRAAFGENDIRIPDEAYLGFEKYKAVLPKDDATGILAYELSAIDWLFTQLADAKISKVVNFKREVLPPENGESWDGKTTTRGGRSGRNRRGSRGKSASAASTVPVAKRLPMELTIAGPADSIRQALQAIANSDEFFFETRLFRYKNTASVPSSQGIKRGTVEEVPADDGGFGEVIEEDAPADAAEPAFSTQILQRVAGGNDVTVFIRLDLLLFDESIKFPVIK